MVAIVVVTVGLGAGTALSASCDLNTLRPVEIGQNSFVYAADGSLLGSIPAERNREPVTQPADVARGCPRRRSRSRTAASGSTAASTTSASRARPGRTSPPARSSRAARRSRSSSSATSTPAARRTFTRKLKEACLAIKLASKWSKEKILNEYLNTVYYGNHAYGVEAAAQTYFSKHASQLTLLESALLAGLPQAPSVYDPFHNPQAALDRRDEVLRALLANHDITLAAVRRGDRLVDALGLKPGRIYTRIKQPYFFSYVIDELEHAVRREHGARGRAEGLHDDRPAPAAARQARRSATSSRTRPTRPRRSSPSSPAPARSAR